MTIVQAITSCSRNDLENEQISVRLEPFTSKPLLLSLSPEEQKLAWVARLKSYRNLELSTHQKEMLEVIIADIEGMEKGSFFFSEKLREDAISMAKITPQVDFINLFCEVSPSLPVLQNSGPVCAAYIINDLRFDVAPTRNSQVTYRADDCNCNWTCNQQLDHCPAGGTIQSPCSGGTSSGCCNAVGGCGFLNMGTCNGRVVCDDI